MAQDSSEVVRNTGTVFAVILCIVTLEMSSFLTRKANVMSQESNDVAKLALVSAEKGDQIAREALARSNTVNDTVLGLTRESATIGVRMAAMAPVPILSEDDLRKDEFQLYVKNRGNVPVTGLRVHLSAVSGLVHAVDDPVDVCTDLESMTFEVSFDDLLMPQGFAFVDLRGPALDYLQRIAVGCRFPDRIYHTPINVMVMPLVGDEPVQAGALNTSGGDQDLLQVRFLPAFLQQPAAKALACAIPVRSKLFSPPPEATLAGPLGDNGHPISPSAVPHQD